MSQQDKRTVELGQHFSAAGFELRAIDEATTIVRNSTTREEYPVSESLLDYTLEGAGSPQSIVAEYVKAISN